MFAPRVCRIVLSVLVAVFSFTGIANAGTPDVLSLQGRLTDDLGNVLNGSFELTFNLYNVPVGGTALWTETHPAVTVVDGLFNVLLGQIGGLSDAEFSNPERYLGVTVGVDPEMSPRIQISSVAFAYRVSTVDSASGGTILGDLVLESNSGVNAMEINQSGLGRGIRIGMDNAGSTETGVAIAMQGSGTALTIVPDGGGSAIDVIGGFGNGSVNLPAQAISGFEITDSSVSSVKLTNEPGAAQDFDTTLHILIGNLTSVGSVTFTAPSDGWVLITATGMASITHASGTFDAIEFGISAGTPNLLAVDQQRQWWCPSALPSATYKSILSAQKILPVFPVNSTTYHVSARNVAGAGVKSVTNVTVSMIFVPTAYGIVKQ